jgi:CBS domain-containing protein
MKAADVMVPNVITVCSEATVHEVAEILLANRISGLPVIDKGKLVGIISEGDLIRRCETGTERPPSRWVALLVGDQGLAANFVKTHARRAADVMTREVIVAAPNTELRDIAALLEKLAIKRIPIMQGAKLVGIVSRSNLVQALATVRKEVKAAIATSDAMIREEVLLRLHAEPWTRLCRINVIVHDGTVELWGRVQSEAEKQGIRVAAELTPGVRAVNNNLSVSSAMVG